MLQPRISIIAGIGKNRELGKHNGLIWRVSNDLKRLKELTMGHPIIMGRKTFTSIGRPLPGRTNIIISHASMCVEECLVYDSFIKGMQAAQAIDGAEIFILGGAMVYKEALPYTDRMYLTLFDAADPDADAYFPEYEKEFAKIISEEAHVDEKTGLPYKWQTRER